MYKLALKGCPENDTEANQWLIDLFGVVGGLMQAQTMLSGAKSGQEQVIAIDEELQTLEEMKRRIKSRSLKICLEIIKE